MKNKMTATAVAMAASVAFLSGCVATGDQYRSDVYTAGQVNQAQEVQTVHIISVMPARVAVSNAQGESTSQMVGMVLGSLVGVALVAGGHGHGSHVPPGAALYGGIAGGAIGSAIGESASGGSQTLVNGVQITFRQGDRIFNSAQVGRTCEYKPGLAVMVSPRPNETRIQPNNEYGCPKEEHK